MTRSECEKLLEQIYEWIADVLYLIAEEAPELYEWPEVQDLYYVIPRKYRDQINIEMP